MQFSDIQAERELQTLQYVLLGGGLAVVLAGLILFFISRGRRTFTAAGVSMAVGLMLMAGSAVAGQIGQDRTFEASNNRFQAALEQQYGMTTEVSLSGLIDAADSNGESPAFVTVDGRLVPVTFRFTGTSIEVEDAEGNPVKPLR